MFENATVSYPAPTHQSALAQDSLMSFAYFSISASMNAANCARLLPTVSEEP
jgi:hypothetical protein